MPWQAVGIAGNPADVNVRVPSSSSLFFFFFFFLFFIQLLSVNDAGMCVLLVIEFRDGKNGARTRDQGTIIIRHLVRNK